MYARRQLTAARALRNSRSVFPIEAASSYPSRFPFGTFRIAFVNLARHQSTYMQTDSTALAVPTKAIYQHDERLRRHLTRLTAIRPFSSIPQEEQALFKFPTDQTCVYAIETTETIFYIQGGGQPCDTGHMSASGQDGKEVRFDVQSVRHTSKGRVLHFGHFKDSSITLQEGDMVEQNVNGARRDLNSRIHTAGHIVGLAVRRLMATTAPELKVTELKAQHYPDASFVEFRGIIDSKYKDALQQQSSDFVSSALPIEVAWYRPEELQENGVNTAEDLPIVAGPDGKVRVVDIVGAGAYPCGGTHVPDTGYVGNVIVRNIKRQKGISKVSYAIADKS
jgi:Ser-tRNA(Ala) deacylase AlaX